MAKKKQLKDKQADISPKYFKRWIVWVIIGVAGIGILLLAMPQKTEKNSTPMAPMFKKQGELTLNGKDGKSSITIDIEIADDDSKREVGMMGRPTMEDKQGMLFVFQEEYRASFWMKNTILPLDMLFINKEGTVITIHKNTTPFSEQTYSASGMTLFVLEVNAGFTDKYGVKEGDRMIWKRF
jgi:uncharacterized membrane protein (UPF0127 family)